MNSSDKTKIQCPFCKELIFSHAKKCKHCGEWLNKKIKYLNFLTITWSLSLLAFHAILFSVGYNFENSSSLAIIFFLVDILIGLASFIGLVIFIFSLFFKSFVKVIPYCVYTVGVVVIFFLSIFLLLNYNSQSNFQNNELDTITKEKILEEINELRLSENLAPLGSNSLLDKSASLKAEDMCNKQYWSHNDPYGNDPWYWIQNVGYEYSNAGENLAKDFTSLDLMLESWKNSPTHFANIVNVNFKEIGIALNTCEFEGVNTMLVVNHFASSAESLKSSTSSQPLQINIATSPDTPVHCQIHSNCGGGSTPLTRAECDNSTCCGKSDGSFEFLKDKSMCPSTSSQSSDQKVVVYGYNSEVLNCTKNSENAIKDLINKMKLTITYLTNCDYSSDFYQNCIDSNNAELTIYERQYNELKNQYCN